MTLKDKAKWFSFEMSFVLAQSYAYACAYAYAYVDAYVAHFAASFCLTICLDPCAYACVWWKPGLKNVTDLFLPLQPVYDVLSWILILWILLFLYTL